VNNQQHNCAIWLDLDCADCMPALFSSFVNAVWIDEAVVVFENQRGQFE
jgi:hypothetical protein